MGGEGGGGTGADCPWCLPLLNEVIARALSICYRGSSSDQGVAMARWTQKGVAWERVQGSGVRVRGVKGHSQLDSTQEEARVRKEGGKVWFFFLRPPSGHSLDANIELRQRDEKWGCGGLFVIGGGEWGSVQHIRLSEGVGGWSHKA